jgi:glucose/arabinose dehydrogenase
MESIVIVVICCAIVVFTMLVGGIAVGFMTSMNKTYPETQTINKPIETTKPTNPILKDRILLPDSIKILTAKPVNQEVQVKKFATLPSGSGLVTCIVPGINSTLLVTTQAGKAYKISENKAEEWLDLAPDLNTQSEAGFLDICLSPDFASTGIFYTKHINRKNETVVSRGKGDSSRGGNLTTLFSTPHSTNGRNHYGGGLEIGPDKMLYFAMGDNEVKDKASDDNSVQGKILKMDPNGGTPIVYVKGLRNPWRSKFAPNGDLYIADVGTDRNKGKERVFVAKPNTKPDCGWPETEDPTGGKYLKPVISWGSQTKGECIIGGIVYRGSKAALTGTYIYGAFRPSDIYAHNLSTGQEQKIHSLSGRNSAIGEDINGEVYFATENIIYSI